MPGSRIIEAAILMMFCIRWYELWLPKWWICWCLLMFIEDLPHKLGLLLDPFYNFQQRKGELSISTGPQCARCQSSFDVWLSWDKVTWCLSPRTESEFMDVTLIVPGIVKRNAHPSDDILLRLVSPVGVHHKSGSVRSGPASYLRNRLYSSYT